MTVTMDALDIDVRVTAERTHDRVTFRLANEHPDTVAVRLEQPVPPGVDQSQVAIDAEYETEPWSDSGDPLEFIRKIDPGETVETGYTVSGAETSTVEGMIRETCVEARDLDGVQLGFLEGRELRVDGGGLGSGENSAKSGTTDLPASVSDYVLQDVGEVDSAEFDWTPVEEDSSGGLLRRLIPFL